MTCLRLPDPKEEGRGIGREGGGEEEEEEELDKRGGGEGENVETLEKTESEISEGKTEEERKDLDEHNNKPKEKGKKKGTDETGKRRKGKVSEEEDEGTADRGESGSEGKDDKGESERRAKTCYWGVHPAGAGEELPPSVSVCFEASPTLLARLQRRLLSLLGRASRYCLPPSHPAPQGMPLEVLRRKVKEARHKLLHHSPPSPSSAPKDPPRDSSSPSESSSPGESLVRVLSTDLLSARGSGSSSGVAEPLQQYWGNEGGGGAAGGEEEIELLQQYLNLQHLARSRKHSAQLRRIRDSLIVKVRSRPNSVVTAQDHTAFSPAHTPKKDRQQLRDFLLDIGFVQDYSLLNRHGYDLATAAHMDALDLAGAGVTEPLHRMALRHELNLVQQPPLVPDAVPETVEEWLEGLGLQDYVENFHQNGIYCPLAALNLTKRDLQLMGVYMQGHRKKILLALAGLKEALFRQK